MNLIITICARGGSKGIPGKNVKTLNGLPLIAYSIKIGLKMAKKYNADFALSTDSDEIQSAAVKYGLESDYIRPAELATDKAGKIGAIADVLSYYEEKHAKKYDYILDMDVTSPLRTMEDLEDALAKLTAVPEALNIFSVNPANRNPYFNMVEQVKDSEYVKVVKPSSQFKSRQQAPVVYDMNASFYIFRRKFFEESHEISTTERSLAYVMPHLCFDLDEPHDFTIMEVMLRENLLDFQL